MLNLSSLIQSIPGTPPFSGSRASVHFEPMLASGERFTIAVAAIGEKGDYRIAPAIRSHVLDAMFGCQSTSIKKLIQIACSSLNEHLQLEGRFEGWTPPMTGVHLGTVQKTASSDLSGLLRQAISTSASLAPLYFEAGVEYQTSDGAVDNTGAKSDQWPDRFRRAVLSKKPHLADYFHASFHVSDKALPSKLFYLSKRAAINTGKLIPGNSLSALLDRNKARLLDLLGIRDRGDPMSPRSHFGLVIFWPGLDAPSYSEHQLDLLRSSIETLKVIGNKYDVQITTVESPEQAAATLLVTETPYVVVKPSRTPR